MKKKAISTLQWLASVQHVGRKSSLVLYAPPPPAVLRRLKRAYRDVYILEPYAPEQQPAPAAPAARGEVTWRNDKGEAVNFCNDAGEIVPMPATRIE